MKLKPIKITICSLALLFSVQSVASSSEIWTLKDCIQYAREKNIQVRTAELNLASAQTDLKAAKAQRYPSLSFGSSQGLTNGNKINDNGNFVTNPQYTGTYSLSTQLTLYSGGKINQTIKKQDVLLEAGTLSVDKAGNDIEINVTQAYLEILYAREAVKTDSQSLESSKAQLDLANQKYEAGIINRSEFAQFQAQYSSDIYNIQLSKNIFDKALLSLKQLLELGIDIHFQIDSPHLDEENILQDIPNLHTVYYTALEVMPEVHISQKQIEASQWQEKIAASSRLPSLNLSASVGTGFYTSAEFAFLNQMGNNFNQNVNIGINIPIYQKRESKSAIEKAKIQTQTAQLGLLDTQKQLLKTIESLYQDALAAQNRYVAAGEKLRSTQLSYELIEEQYNAGMRTLVDMLVEKNNYLSAQQEKIQAKYQAVLSIRLLKFYQNEPIQL